MEGFAAMLLVGAFVFVALCKWPAEIIEDLGGPENISAQQRILVNLITNQLLMLESIDPYVLKHRR